MKFKIFLVCLVLFIGLAYAAEIKHDFSFSDEDQDELVGNFNSFVDSAPPVYFFWVGSEKVNVEVKRLDGETFAFGAKLENGKIIEYHKDKIENAALKIRFSELALNKVMNSEDREDEFLKQVNARNITVDNLSILNLILQLKLLLGQLFLFVFGVFKFIIPLIK